MESNRFLKKIRDDYSTRYAYIKNDICITYAELYKLIDINRKSILELGINKDDCVILQRKDQLEFSILFLSLLSIGCYIVPVSDGITEFELDKVKKKVMPKTIDDIQVMLHCDTIEEEQDLPDFYSGDDCGIYHMTSGSTGEEKYCVRTFNNLYAEAESYVETCAYSYNDRIISTAPLNHSFALGSVIIPALLSGASVYTLNGLSPIRVMKMVPQNKITVIITVPAIVKMFCIVEKQYDFSTIRMVLAGAGVITAELHRMFLEKFHTHLYGNYGSTETGGLICRLNDENIAGKKVNPLEVDCSK
ncbi:AMP-binding protein [Anaeromicropila populeti]|uniref:AMP-binding enzyme n=1 Tax=Anaeromicropila populeti TaxID=37658 RepID=A0A1I6K6Z1_9FIRM|nr:AMP-binding protein [Anaeromicropila populeti]SFR87001.1 AMP-binding enzyme [Anaeromicropila populeti]